MRSAVGPQPEPRTSAMSWRSAPVRSAMTAAAAEATSKGSVWGRDRSRGVVALTRSAYRWLDGTVSASQSSVVIIGGGPGGYEAALAAAQLGAQVTVVEREAVGGAAVLTDCVPSKALIATADFMDRFSAAHRVGVGFDGAPSDQGVTAHLADVNRRIMNLAAQQSRDIRERLESFGVDVIAGAGRLVEPGVVEAVEGVGSVESGREPAPSRRETSRGRTHRLRADVVLVATGARPRIMDTAVPDGERILTWQQIWDLTELPERLIVIGSGVTGAEFSHAYLGLGCEVVLVSSRDRVLPGQDADAANVIEDVFRRRGMEVLNRSRAAAVERHGDT